MTCFKALVEAKISQRYDPIRLATHGIVFFATPHQGGNHASLGKIVAEIINRSIRNAPNKLLKALQPESDFLVKLDSDFRHQLEQYSFVSFFETKYYGGLDVVSTLHFIWHE